MTKNLYEVSTTPRPDGLYNVWFLTPENYEEGLSTRWTIDSVLSKEDLSKRRLKPGSVVLG